MSDKKMRVTPEWIVHFWPVYAATLDGYREGDVDVKIPFDLFCKVEQIVDRDFVGIENLAVEK